MKRQHIGQAPSGLAVFFAALSVMGMGAAHAGSFSVNPVRVTLSAKQPVAAITVRNAGAEPAVVQLETSAWSQDQGKDVLVPSTDVLATPPIFTVAPGKTQILRIGLRRPSTATDETTYRLILREVPPATPAEGLRVALKISMPVFVVPAASVAPALQWRATRTADGQIRVRVTNTGTAHVQMTKIDLALAEGGTELGSHTLADYVLPGNTRSWTVKTASPAAVGAKVRIKSMTDAGAFDTSAALEVETADGGAPTAPLAAR
jgi:fimbrial chaperone protein